jgi:hypothetical protein
MKTIIYYAMERIEPADVELAQSRAGGPALHVRIGDSDWPADLTVETATLVSSRDYNYRDEFMEFLNRLVERLPKVELHGVDLIEVIRYQWLFAAEEDYHSAWALATIIRDHHPERIVLASKPDKDFRGLSEWCGKQGVELVESKRSSTNSLVRQMRGLAYRAKFAAYQWRQGRRHRARTSVPPLAAGQSARVVFSEFYPNSTKVAEATADGLTAMRPIDAVFVAGRDVVKEALSKCKYPLYHFDEFGAADLRLSRKLVRSFSQAFERLDASLFVTDVSHPPCKEFLMPALRRTGVQFLRSAAIDVSKTRSMLDTMKPKMVVSTTFASIYGRALALAAKQEGIPSVYVQHGILGQGRFYSYMPFSHSLVWGDCNKRALVKCGATGVAVVGAPNQDEMIRWRTQSSSNGSANAHEPRILFLASRAAGSVTSATMFEKILIDVYDAALAVPGAKLVVKIHPGDHTGIAARVLQGKERVTLLKEGSSLELITQCDLAIVTSSATGLETCALDKPLVVFLPDGVFNVVDYQGYGAAVIVNDGAALKAALQEAFKDNQLLKELTAGRRKLLDDMLDGATGESRSKAAAALCQILDES